VVEQFLTGEEASFILIADGEDFLPMATSQDHKRAFDGDEGPNTGGMGAYSPAPIVTNDIYERIIDEVIKPTLKGMRREGNYYSGFLYAGLMISDDGTPNVIEFNCRFGDPETQPVLLRLKSDLVAHCLAAVEGSLNEEIADWESKHSLGVVMASGGYPGSYKNGNSIKGLLNIDDTLDHKIFHSGTKIIDGQVVTDGGRVLCVTALGNNLSQAKTRAYDVVSKIHWNDVQYRTDIGWRAMKNIKSAK
jgi:phosphoribosylamine--glycine ligase